MRILKLSTAIFTLLILSNCSTIDDNLTNETNDANNSEDFIAIVSSAESLNRSKDLSLDLEEFASHAENTINLLHSIPFIEYEDSKIYFDTLSLMVNDLCLMDSSKIKRNYDTIFSKLKCNVFCGLFDENQLQLVKLNILSTDCDSNVIELLTVVGNPTLGPVVSEKPANFNFPPRREFVDEELWSICSDCTTPLLITDDIISNEFYGGCAPYEISVLATRNLNHLDYYHTIEDLNYLQNIENIFIPQWNTYPVFEWWLQSCEYIENHNCPFALIEEVSCYDFFLEIQGGGLFAWEFEQMTSLGNDVFCLNTDELNANLLLSEQIAKIIAYNDEQRLPIYLDMQTSIFDCSGALSFAWQGKQINARKKYRTEVFPLDHFDNECNCDK